MAKKRARAVKRAKRRVSRTRKCGVLTYMWAAVILLLAAGIFGASQQTAGLMTATSAPSMFAIWTDYQGAGQAGYNTEVGPKNGQVALTAAPGELVVGSPLYDGKYVYFQTNDNNLYRTDINTDTTKLIYNFDKDGTATPGSMPIKATIILKVKVTDTNYEQGKHEFWKPETHDTIAVMLTTKIIFIEEGQEEGAGKVVKELAYDGRTQPIVNGNYMFIRYANGYLYKLNMKDDLKPVSGFSNWKPLFGYGPTMTLYKNNIYFVSEGGIVCKASATEDNPKANALPTDLKIMKRVWCTDGLTPSEAPLQIEGTPVGAPVVMDKRVYVATDQKLYAIYDNDITYSYSNDANGEKAWIYRNGAAQQPTVYPVGLNKHAIYYVDRTGFVHMLNNEGKEVWESPGIYMSTRSPMIATGIWPNINLYLKDGSYAFMLNGIDSTNGGTKLWSHYVGEGKTSLIETTGILFVGGENGLLAFADDETGPAITLADQSMDAVETGYLGTDQITLSGEVVDGSPSSGLNKVEIQVQEDGTWSIKQLLTFRKHTMGTNISLSYTPTAPEGSTVSWRIYAEDNVGNKRASSVRTFRMVPESSVDTYEPWMISSETDKGEVAVYFESFNVKSTWQDDFELQNVTLIADENGKKTEYSDYFDGSSGESETREWQVYGQTPGATISLRVRACDIATDHGASDDRCTEENIGSVYVRDTIPPAVSSIAQDKDVISYNEDIKLTVSASDSVGLASITFRLWDGEKTFSVSGTEVSETYTFRPSSLLQGQIVDWSAYATDLAGNKDEFGSFKRFTIKDTTTPKITGVSVPQSTSVNDMVVIPFNIYDNETLVEQYKGYVEYDGNTDEVCVGYPYKDDAPDLACEFEAKEAYRTAASAKFYIKAYDSYSNEKVTTKMPLAVTVSCKQADTTPPFASFTTQSSTEVLPGSSITLSTKLTDSIDQYGCGGLKTAVIYAKGEDGIERTITTINLDDATKPGAKTSTYAITGGGTGTKVTETSANYTWNVPEEYKPVWSDILVIGIGAPTTNAGILGGAGGISGFRGIAVGTLGFAVAPGLIEGATASQTGATIQRPFAIPGTKVTWYIKSYDYEGNERTTFAQTFSVKDEKPPEFSPQGTNQSSARMLPGSSVKLSGCMADAGQLKEAVFEVNFAGTWVGVKSFDMLSEKKWAGAKACKDFDYSNPAIRAGTDVSWRIRAVDTEGNEATTGELMFKVSTNPPTWTNKKVTPQNPLQGEEVTISVDWNDDAGLKEAGFATNETGVWKEVSKVSLVGTSDTAVFKWKNSLLTPGTVVAWKVTGIDNDGNMVDSDPEFTIAADTTAPTWSELAQSSNTPAQGEVVFLSAKFTDNAGMQRAILETDESGEFRSMSVVYVTGKEPTARFSWQNPNIEVGKTVKWRVKGIDVAGNSVLTDEKSFVVQKAPTVCPRCPTATEWTSCIRGKQTRTSYSCDAATNYACQSKFEETSCVNTPQEIALYAVEDARAAVEAGLSEGRNVEAAQSMLAEAEAFYADGKYVDAKLKADEATAAAGAAPTMLKPVEILWVALIVVVAISAVTLVMLRKKLFGTQTPAPSA